jgi:DNA-binding CsgD family transcriptional regulator
MIEIIADWDVSAADEGQIVRLLAQGYSQKEAAKRLGMAYGTVRKHTMAMRARTECRSTTEIVCRAIQDT